ncbi:MAG: chorismate-binding protein [Kofleriaceae bacterium]
MTAVGPVTPVAAAARLRGQPGRVLCHAAADVVPGRGSVVAAWPWATLTVWPDRLEWGAGGVATVERGDPVAAIGRFLDAHAGPLAAAGPRTPRVVGYLAYDLGRAVERLGPRPPGPPVPDAWLAAYPALAWWPAGAATPTLVGDDAVAIARLAAAISAGPDVPGPPLWLGLATATQRRPPTIAARRHPRAARRATSTRSFRRATWPHRSRRAGRRAGAVRGARRGGAGGLRRPAEAGPVTVVSVARVLLPGRRPAGDRADQGHRPRAAAADVDAAAAASWRSTPKDAAEHLMIVDLERNDLGRIAEVGSVAVDELGKVVALPTVFHLVSTVSARPRPGLTWAALVRATFPGGSITGAPKVRAMQLIDQLEPVARGAYCGALGWFGTGGGLDLAIAIRIAQLTADNLAIHVGGGIVFDSEPAAELAETDDKAAAWRAALARLTAPGAPA